MSYSPLSASKKYNVSRSSIMRAIYDKTLNAQRDNKNRWKLEADDIEAWLAVQKPRLDTDQNTVRKVTTTVLNSSDDARKINELRVELAAEKARSTGLEARLADTQADRDRIAALLEKALESRTVEVASRGFFSRLFNR